jgi:hypothetical protein
MKLELEPLELSTIIASIGKSRHYFECIRKDQDTADSLQQIRLKLIKQGEKKESLRTTLYHRTSEIVCKVVVCRIVYY